MNLGSAEITRFFYEYSKSAEVAAYSAEVMVYSAEVMAYSAEFILKSAGYEFRIS